jgi:hypothetical protein
MLAVVFEQMRKLLIALTALSATLAFTGSASAARPATTTTVHAKKLGTTPSSMPYDETEWVAKADSGTIAWGSTVRGSRATTVTDGGTVRAVPAQPGCTAMTAGAGNIGYDCSPVHDEADPYATLSTRVVPLAGGTARDVSAIVPVAASEAPAPPGLYEGRFRLDGIGTRWAHFSQNCDLKYCAPRYSQDVNWQTGAAAAVKTLDPRLREDLDATALTVPLCSPLRSDMPAVLGDGENPTIIPVVFDRPWAILAGAAHPLRRCGSSRAVPLPAHYVPVALGAGWALLQKSQRYPDGPNTTKLLRLADHRIVNVAGAVSRSSYAQAAITAGRVVFTAHEPDGSQTVYTARLPRA